MTDKKLAIQLKIDKAKSLINEVDILIENHFYSTAVSRLYYSCFHATKALLLTKDLTSKTHSGALTLLNKHFVATGEFEKEQAVFFSKLMKERISEDYNDYMIHEFSVIQPYLLSAREYLDYTLSLTTSFLSNK